MAPQLKPPKRVYIETNGCAVQRHETQRLAKFFRENGFEEVSKPDDASLILMTTCGVVNWTEDAAIAAIERLSKFSPKAKLLVGGCLPKINPDRIRRISEDIVMFGPKEEGILNDLVSAAHRVEGVSFNCDPVREHSFGDPEIAYSKNELDQLRLALFLDSIYHTSNFSELYNYLTKGRHLWEESGLFEIKVASGCGSRCSYCATKLAIGDMKSEGVPKILEQVKLAVSSGYKKIILMGDEVGFYGIDTGTNLGDLLNRIVEASGDARIALRYLHPDALVKNYGALREHFQSGKIYYFCSAFQSGSPKILRLMHRNPALSGFIDVMKDVGSISTAYKHTQIIVGFPQETADDFNMTLEALRGGNFDYITTTAYKDRPGTLSAGLPGHIDEQAIQERYGLSLQFVDENRNMRLWSRISAEVALNSKK